MNMQRPDQASLLPGPDLMRGARAFLGWSSTDAGRRAAVSVAAVINAEGKGAGLSQVQPDEVTKLRRAYEGAGVRFIDDSATGRGISVVGR